MTYKWRILLLVSYKSYLYLDLASLYPLNIGIQYTILLQCCGQLIDCQFHVFHHPGPPVWCFAVCVVRIQFLFARYLQCLQQSYNFIFSTKTAKSCLWWQDGDDERSPQLSPHHHKHENHLKHHHFIHFIPFSLHLHLGNMSKHQEGGHLVFCLGWVFC